MSKTTKQKPVIPKTRTEALREGLIVSLDDRECALLGIAAGFLFPISLSRELFEVVSTWANKDLSEAETQFNIARMLSVLRAALSPRPQHPTCDILLAKESTVEERLLSLKCLCGPDDAGELVITIMLADEPWNFGIPEIGLRQLPYALME